MAPRHSLTDRADQSIIFAPRQPANFRPNSRVDRSRPGWPIVSRSSTSNVCRRSDSDNDLVEAERGEDVRKLQGRNHRRSSRIGSADSRAPSRDDSMHFEKLEYTKTRRKRGTIPNDCLYWSYCNCGTKTEYKYFQTEFNLSETKFYSFDD